MRDKRPRHQSAGRVVSNRPGAREIPEATYDEYADRGESENRNKELQCQLFADRFSEHRCMATLFRLNMHTLACNLLVRLRRLIADPPAPPRVEHNLPLEARSIHDKRRHFNQQ